MANKKTNNSGFISTEDWLPLVDIKDGMMEAKGTAITGHQYISGIRIEPRNIFITDTQNQINVINNLRDFYNTIDYEFWLVCCDRPVDINLYKSELEVMYVQEEDPKIRKMIGEDLAKCDMFVGPQINAVDTEYYILLKESVKNKDVLMKKIQNLISNLARAGLNSRQVTNEDLRVILDAFFNDSLRTEFGTVMTNV